MNDLEKLKERLEEKSMKAGVGSAMKRFLVVLPTIEKALLAGMSHQEVWNEMTLSGFTFSLESFRTMLYRARKKTVHSDGSPTYNSRVEQPALAPRQNGVERLPTHESAIVNQVTVNVRDGIPDPSKLNWTPGKKLGPNW